MDVHAGSFNTGTATAGNTVAVTGLGFEPKIVFFWWNGRVSSSDGLGVPDSSANVFTGFGAMSGASSRWAIGGDNEDGQATSNLSWRNTDAGCILDPNGFGSAEDGRMDFSAFGSDGFTLVVDIQMNIDLRIHYLALGGTDLTDVATGFFVGASSTGIADAVTSLSFDPEFVLLASNGQTSTPPAGGTGHKLGIGMATSNSSRGVVYTAEKSAIGTTEADRYAFSGEIHVGRSGTNLGALPCRADFEDFVPSTGQGFRLDWLETGFAGTAQIIFYVCLRGGDYAVGNLATRTSTGSIAVSGLGFDPQGALLISHCTAEDSQDTIGPHSNLSIGAFSSATDRASASGRSEDAVSTSNVEIATEHDHVYTRIGITSDVLDGTIDIDTLDTGGFTLDQDDGDPDVAFVLYAAFGPVAAGGTTFFETVTGAFTPVGAVVRGGELAFDGSFSPAGSIGSEPQKLLDGATAPSSALIREAQIVLDGLIAPSGILTAIKTILLTLVGTIATAGALIRSPRKIVAGAVTPIASLARETEKTVAGILPNAGALARLIAKSIGGNLPTAGALITIKTILLTIAGTIVTAGVLIREPRKFVSGTVAPSSSIARRISKGIAGNLPTSGSLARFSRIAVSGTLALAGVVATSTGIFIIIAKTVLKGSFIRALSLKGSFIQSTSSLKGSFIKAITLKGKVGD